MKKYIIVIVFMVVIGLSVYIFLDRQSTEQSDDKQIKQENEILPQGLNNAATTAKNWQTYTNDKFGYSIDYPNDWTFREFPSSKTGAGFRLIDSSDDIVSECIVVDMGGAVGMEYYTPFDEYVKRAAAVSIEGYKELNSIEFITGVDGLTGYKTTWVHEDRIGEKTISLPITYFENEKIILVGQLKYKAVNITLNNKDCEDVYNKMILTFKKSKAHEER